MAERDLAPLLQKLRSTSSYSTAAPLLSQAKLLLLKLNALTPTSGASPAILAQAREAFELGALLSICATLPDVFVRYVNLLRPFYDLADCDSSSHNNNNNSNTDRDQRNKITGLYLLLLLTQGDYSAFHTELESLQARWPASAGGHTSANGHASRGPLEDDKYLGYPIKLERWLMEGAYDLVWRAMESGHVPSEEYGIFRAILTTQIRSEIASCSETAYPSLPISSTKNLLFLESEGAVVQFAATRGWSVHDGRIYFPVQAAKAAHLGSDDDDDAPGERKTSVLAIENTLGYARELETIV